MRSEIRFRVNADRVLVSSETIRAMHDLFEETHAPHVFLGARIDENLAYLPGEHEIFRMGQLGGGYDESLQAPRFCRYCRETGFHQFSRGTDGGYSYFCHLASGLELMTIEDARAVKMAEAVLKDR